MILFGCYIYVRDIFSKKVYKVFVIVKWLFFNLDMIIIIIKNKFFDVFVKFILLYGCEIWGLELLLYKIYFDKSIIE